MSTDKICGGNELLNPQQILEQRLKLYYGAKVGDLGCGGLGFFSFKAAELVGETGLVYSVDILKMVLKNIEHRAKMLGLRNIQTIWSNLEIYGGANINDGELNFALLVNILFQNKHPEKIMREAARMLESGAKLLVVDWKQGRFPLGPPADKKITPERVNDIALGAGFKKMDEFSAGRFHYGIIFDKI